MQTSHKYTIGMGILAMALGMIPLLAVLGILPTRPHQPGDSPAWIGAAIGLMFFLAGVSIIVQSLTNPNYPNSGPSATSPLTARILYDVLGLTIAVLLVSIFTWVAFGSGPREFTMSGGDGSSFAATHASPTMGRIAFGFGAVLGWLAVGWMSVTAIRRWFPRRSD